MWLPPEPTLFDSFKPLIEDFEKQHPEYRVRMGSVTARDATGDPTRFLLGVAGGVPPDLIYFDRFAVVEWASRGAFADLTPYINRDQDLPDGIREENFYPVAWQEALFGGKNYAIANNVDTRALYYLEDPLIRAGCVYKTDDPEVQSGQAQAGDARPPKTWEEMCRKRLHASGQASADGTVRLADLVRRSAVNVEAPQDAKPNLKAAGVREGDVVALVSGANVFRGRIRSVADNDAFRIDLERDQRPGARSLPAAFVGECEVKVYDQDSYVCRLTRYDPQTGQISALGFIPMFGNSWLYMFGWQNGGEFMSPDMTQCTLDHPGIIEALQWLTDTYDAMGGFQSVTVFQKTAMSGGMDPFIVGRVAMRIDTSLLISTVMSFKPELRFRAVAAPIPEKRLAAGAKPLGWTGGWSYAIPATAKQQEGAWILLRHLCSIEANKLQFQYRATMNRARGLPFFPDMHPDKRIMAWIRETYVDGNPAVSPAMQQAFGVFEALLPNSRYRPVTPVGQKLWSEHVRAAETALNHVKQPYDALNYGKRQVQDTLDRFLNPPQGALVHWSALIAAYAIGAAALFGGMAWRQERKRREAGGKRGAWLDGYVAASPWLIGFIVFGAGPILFSIIISFCQYDVLNPARFVGFDNYVSLLGRHYDDVIGATVWNDPVFWKSLGNTLFMVIGAPLGIALGLAIALLLDTKVRGLHIYRTIYYLPAIVPAVASFILWLWILDPTRGMLNQALAAFGVHNPPNWLQDPLWAKPALILMGLWGVGAGMIIWLAGLKDIPESLYEAAEIDGANRVRRFIHITIPLLSPYIFFNLIMGLIGAFQVFEAAFIMTDGGPADATLFYAYKLFNEAFRFLNMGVASAIAWLLFIVVLLITLLQLWLGKKWVHYGG